MRDFFEATLLSGGTEALRCGILEKDIYADSLGTMIEFLLHPERRANTNELDGEDSRSLRKQKRFDKLEVLLDSEGLSVSVSVSMEVQHVMVDVFTVYQTCSRYIGHRLIGS